MSLWQNLHHRKEMEIKNLLWPRRLTLPIGLMIRIDCTHQNLLVQLALHWSTVSRLLQLLPAGRPSLYSCTPCFTSYAIFFHIVEHLSWVYLFGVVVSEETRMAQHWRVDWRDEKMGGLENQWNLEFCLIHSFLAPVCYCNRCSVLQVEGYPAYRVWNNYRYSRTK